MEKLDSISDSNLPSTNAKNLVLKNSKSECSDESYMLKRFFQASLEVDSAKQFADNVNKNNSVCSQETFKVNSPKFIKKYIVDKTMETDQLQIHNKNQPDNQNSPETVSTSSSEKKIKKDLLINNQTKSNIQNDSDRSSSEKSESIKKKVKLDTKLKTPEDTTGKSTQQQTGSVDSQKTYKYDKIIEIIIHKTDRLQLSPLIIHPVVKIHIINKYTGRYLLKSDKHRPINCYTDNDKIDYILPVMTHNYNLQGNRILFPSWEESILLNEDFEYFTKGDSQVIIFFEVMDFITSAILHQEEKKCFTNGWHSIAFAFLKLHSPDGLININKKIRLQLYFSYETTKVDAQICFPWKWWKERKLKKYPSTIYITIKPATHSLPTEDVRIKHVNQKETKYLTKLKDNSNNASNLKINENREKRKVNVCSLPNKCLVKFKSYGSGCLIAKFSNDGNHLACALQIETLFYIVLYSAVSLTEVNKLYSHQGLVYDIKWSKDDCFLLSASADNTVNIFHLPSNSLFQILPHPSYVYCCDISDKIVVSGCYDKTVRIWRQNDSKSEFYLLQELESHTGYITSLCFYKSFGILSADSDGLIIEWYQKKTKWIMKRQIELIDLKKTIINQILLFSKQKRLLVHCRDSIIRIIDLKSSCILKWLKGCLNKRFQTYCTISPDGTFVYSGSENGFVYVWNSKSGQEVATYLPFSSEQNVLTIHCVEFHPHENILVISQYGRNLPILMYSFDNSISQPMVNLSIKKEFYQYTKQILSSMSSEINIVTKNNKDETEKKDFRQLLQKMDTLILKQK